MTTESVQGFPDSNPAPLTKLPFYAETRYAAVGSIDGTVYHERNPLASKPATVSRRSLTMGLLLCTVGGVALAHLPTSTYTPFSNSGDSSPSTVQVRGTIVSVSNDSITVKGLRDEPPIALALNDKTKVAQVFAVPLDSLAKGAYVGVAAMPEADGSQTAIAVTVFPESLRGIAEGFRDFDLRPQSTMTNATVGTVSAVANGRQLQLHYKNGQKTIHVPATAPIVSFQPAQRDLLVPGASISVTAGLVQDQPTALRIRVGKDGFQVPY